MPIVPGTNPALQTWNGQNFVVSDGSVQNPISLPNLEISQDQAQYVIGTNNTGRLSYYNPLNLTNGNNLEVTATGSTTARTLANRFADVVNVKDFGAIGNGVADDTAAIQAATNTGNPVFFPAGIYKMLSSVSYAGTVVWFGSGSQSIIKNDSTVISVTSGNNSIIDNIYLQSITWPSIISRNVNTWVANPTPYTSRANNHSGYQPTANDSDLSPTPTYTTIGPVISFQGNASNITISRIYGIFVTINVQDAIYSTVRDCNFQGGTGLGGIVFFNINNQKGEGNSAVNNTINYASNSGITFVRNYDGLAQGNIVSYCGESGIKTYQNTINSVDARCYEMQFIGNTSFYQFYDGFDFSSDYPQTGTVDSRHQIIGNLTYGNRGTGFYADGSNNQFIGNNARKCQNAGISLYYNNSIVSNNFVYGCNVASGTYTNQFNFTGGSSNKISSNYINNAGNNGYSLYAPGSNLVSGNEAIGGTIFIGNANSVTAQTIGNVDQNYGISGTFNPTITVGTTLQTTYSIQKGTYTRLGQRVFFDITIQLNQTISGTGNISISGLPFTAFANGVYGSVSSVISQNTSYTGVLMGLINDGSSAVGLLTDTNGTAAAITDSNITGNSKFYISGSYLASA